MTDLQLMRALKEYQRSGWSVVQFRGKWIITKPDERPRVAMKVDGSWRIGEIRFMEHGDN